MNNKTKNIISNIFGIFVLGLFGYEYFTTKEIGTMTFLATVAAIAIFYKINESKVFLSRFLNSKIK